MCGSMFLGDGGIRETMVAITEVLKNSPLISEQLIVLRDKCSSRKDFREALTRTGLFLGYEIAKCLQTEEIEVVTPLGKATQIKRKDPVVIVGVLRSSLPLIQGLLEAFPDAEVGIIGTSYEDAQEQSKRGDKSAPEESEASSDVSMLRRRRKLIAPDESIPLLDNKVVIIADATLATGSCVSRVLQNVSIGGTPRRVIVTAAIASEHAIRFVRGVQQDAWIYVGAVDDEVDLNGFVVPGLGNAGERIYGRAP